MRRRGFMLGTAGALALPAARASTRDLVIAQVAPLSGVLASSGEQMVLGGKLWFEHVNATGLRRAGPDPTRARIVQALQGISSLDLGGFSVGYSPQNRVGSHYVEVSMIGSTGKLLK